MRKLIAGMKISLDGKTADANGYADWVSAWSDDYDVMPQVDACVLGAGMYPGYEAYWTTIRNEPAKPLAMTGKTPTPAEIVWAHFAAETPHYVLSKRPERRRLAEHALPAQRRGRRRAQAAGRQGHLPRRRRADDRGPDRRRARR